MSKRTYTIMVMKATAKMRTFHLSVRAIKTFATVVTLCLAVFTFFAYEYVSNRRGMGELENLREDYNKKEMELRNLAKSVEYLKKDMDNLQKFNRKFRIVAGLPQSEDNLQQTTGMGGEIGDSYIDYSQQRKDQFIQNVYKEIDQLRIFLQSEQDSLHEMGDALSEKKSLLTSTPSVWPVRGWMTSGFGHRESPFTGQREFHAGIDIATRFGAPVRATADGVVTYSGRKGGLGNLIVIEHGFGYSTRFGHTSKIIVSAGARVKRNQIIGYVGNTGRSTGPHLHYEVRINGVSTNPFDYILN